MASDGFYKAFEDRHRGSREAIKQRLGVYLPFVLSLREVYPGASGLDLGCGRGEWLELMRENGLTFQGVDSDPGMMGAAQDLGLDVSLGDAFERLSSLPSESLTAVTAFHFVEHIPVQLLQHLVGEAFRVLKPGGILILETPNPENIIVATTNFYLDPSHTRPLPPELLSFSLEFLGFEAVKVLRLNQGNVLVESQAILGVLNGVSPDVAVVGQKSGCAALAQAVAPAFAKDYGLTIETISSHYDSLREARFHSLETRTLEVEAALHQLRESVVRLEEDLCTIVNGKPYQLAVALNAMRDNILEWCTRYKIKAFFSLCGRLGGRIKRH